jgi:subtilisin-like proprotein convertase family protein
VQFVARDGPVTYFIRADRIEALVRSAGEGQAAPGGAQISQAEPAASQTLSHLQIVFRNQSGAAVSAASVEGQQQNEGKVNYLIGNDPGRWHVNVPTFASVRLKQIRPGIDLLLRFDAEGHLAYELDIASSTDPSSLRLAIDGEASVEADADGNLIVTAAGSQLTLTAPRSFVRHRSLIGGVGESEVPSKFVRADNKTIYHWARRDPSQPLRVDPSLVWRNTALGGSSYETATSVAVDSEGQAVVAGYTNSMDFPTTTGAYRRTGNPYDYIGLVTKYSASGDSFVFSTYLGGYYDSGTGDPGDARLYDVALSQTGQVYVVGKTRSFTYPTTSGAVQASCFSCSSNASDAVLSVLDETGSSLVYSTYLGAGGNDVASAVAVGPGGDAFVAGTVDTSFGFPITVDTGFSKTFFTRISVTGGGLIYSGFASSSPAFDDMAVDAAGNVYLAFRVKELGEYLGSWDDPLYGAMLVKLRAPSYEREWASGVGIHQPYATYYGRGAAVAVAPDNSVYVAGTQPWQPQWDVGPVPVEAWVAKVRPAGGYMWVRSFRISDDERFTMQERVTGIATDPSGNPYVVGAGKPPAPINAIGSGTRQFFASLMGDDGYLRILSPVEGSSTFDAEIAVDNAGDVYRMFNGGSVGLEKYTMGLWETVSGQITNGPWAVVYAYRTSDETYAGIVTADATGAFRLLVPSGTCPSGGYKLFAAANGLQGQWYLNKSSYSSADCVPSNASGLSMALPPAAPGNLSAQALSGEFVHLSWTDNSSVESGFEIERSREGGSFVKIAEVTPGATAYDDTGVLPETQYSYRVRAVSIYGPSEYSNVATVTTPPPPPPAAPSDLSAVFASPYTAVFLSWRDNSSSELGFRIEKSVNGAPFFQLAQVGADTTEFIDSSVSYGNTYSYRVRAFNSGGSSGSSNVATVGTAPVAPSALSVSVLGSHRVDLSWVDNAANETTYTVERDSGGGYAALAVLPANSSSYTDSTAPANAVSKYRVMVSNGFGFAYSPEVSATTPPYGQLQVEVVNGSWGAVDVFDAATGALVARQCCSPDGIYRFDLPATTCPVIGYKVHATPGSSDFLPQWYSNASDFSGASCVNAPASISMTLRPYYPPPPTELTGYAVDPWSVQISWTHDSPEETGFSIERSAEGGPFAEVATVPADQTTWTDDGLRPSVVYTYRVRAFNERGYSGYSNEVSIRTPDGPLLEIAGFEVEDLGDHDGGLSSGEQGRITVAVRNVGTAPAPSPVVRLMSRDFAWTVSEVVFPDVDVGAVLTSTSYAGTYIAPCMGDALVDITASFSGRDFFLGTRPGTVNYREVSVSIPSVDVPVPFSLAGEYSSRLVLADYYGMRLIDLDVTATILHASTKWLTVGLEDPSGRRVTLFDRREGSNIGPTIFDDEASEPISAGASPFIGTFRPEQALATLDGASVTGNWRLWAKNHLSYSGQISSWGMIAVMRGCRPLGPVGLSAVATSHRRVELSWTDRADNEAGFVIERAEGEGSFTYLATVGPDVTSFVDQSVSPGTSYRYRVIATNGAGTSSTAAATSITTPNGPVLSLAGVLLRDLGDSDGKLDTGEEFEVLVQISNTGDRAATDVRGRLAALTGDALLSVSDSPYPDILPGSTETNSVAYRGTYMGACAQPVQLVLDLAAAEDSVMFSLTFDLAYLDFRDGALTAASTDTPVSLPDPGMYESTISITEPATILDVNVGLTVFHWTPPELRITLVGPDGTTSTLFDRRGTNDSSTATRDVGPTTFDDEAITPVALGKEPFPGSYRPETPLAAFDGRSLAGNWRLRIEDLVRDNRGTLGGWSLAVSYRRCSNHAAPSGLSGHIWGSDAVELSWQKNGQDETAFVIERDDGSGFVEVGRVPASETSYLDIGLTGGHTYAYRVKSTGPRGDSPYSVPIQVETPGEVQLKVNVPGDQWSGVYLNSRLTGSRVASQCCVGTETYIFNVPASYCPVGGYAIEVHPSAGYSSQWYDRKQSFLTADCVQAPGEITVTLQPSLPSAPTDLTATATGARRVELSWADSSSNESGFVVERDSGSGFSVIATVPAGTTSYVDRTVSAVSSYTYRVAAQNSQGISDYSNTVTVQTPGMTEIEVRVEGTAFGAVSAFDQETGELAAYACCSGDGVYRLRLPQATCPSVGYKIYVYGVENYAPQWVAGKASFAAADCMSAPQSLVVNLEPAGAITGVVRDWATGEELPGVLMYAWDASTGSFRGWTKTGNSGTPGSFKLALDSGATYKIKAVGDAAHEDVWFPSASGYSGAGTVAAPGTADFSLRPAGWITGLVTVSGSGRGGVYVSAYEECGCRSPYNTLTGADGTYALKVVSSAESGNLYKVRFIGPSGKQRWYPDVPSFGGAVPVSAPSAGIDQNF